MSARHAHYFSCDYCGTAESPKGNTPAEARSRATEAGWRDLNLIGEDMCPKCIKVRSENARGISKPDKPPPEPKVEETVEEFSNPVTEYQYAKVAEMAQKVLVTKETIDPRPPDLMQSARRLGLTQ